MKISFFAVVFVVVSFLSNQALAQQSTVTIRVTNGAKPVPFSQVRISLVSDSTKSWSKPADSIGLVVFNLEQDLYNFRASAVNFIPVIKNLRVNQSDFQVELIMRSQSNSLKEVTITATRPMMRQEDDKTIVDPENLAASSSSAYEIIEKTPGLFLDQDGNIYLSSTTPATIYINGREQKMSSADIASMLKSLPPNSIASIEIMRTPSSKYEASSTGGIVNVVLKKGVKIGLTGSLNFNMNQGNQGNQLLGFNINKNSGKLSTYLNMQYARRHYSEVLRTDRFFATDSIHTASVLMQESFTLYPTDNYYTGIGANYSFNDKWELGYDVRLNYSNSGNTSENVSQIKKISSNEISDNNTTSVGNTSNSFNVSQGLNLKYKIDSVGSDWTTDISFNYLPGRSKQDYTNVPFNPQTQGNGDISTNLNSFSLQSNLVYKFPKKWTAESGIKTSILSFNTNRDYFTGTGNNQTADAQRSGAYSYRENINAAYAQLSKSFGSFILKVGTRVENTNMEGNQTIPSDTSFRVHRTDFFPYIYLSRKVMSIGSLDLRGFLIARRTISRPDYQLLNPAERYVDQYLYETGNPSLRPQFTDNYEMNVSVNDYPVFALGINDTHDIFTQVLYSAENNRQISYRTTDNLGSNKETYFRLVGGIPPGKGYFFVIGAQYNHNFYNGLYEQKPLEFKKGSWSLFTYQSLKVGAFTQLSVNGFVRFRGQMQFYELDDFGMLNFQMNRQLLKKKITLSLSVNDIFETNNNTFTLNQGSIKANGERRGDTRRFGLSLRYNFGIVKKEQTNPFNIESPEKGTL